MDSVTRVRKALHFQYPDRFPYDFDESKLPADAGACGSDMLWVSPAHKVTEDNVNEWGVKYEVIEGSHTFGEPKVFPLAGRDSLEGFRFPDFTEAWRYEALADAVKQNGGKKYVLGMLPNGIFHPMFDLLGFEDFCLQILLNEPLVDELCEKLTESAVSVCTEMARYGVDGIITIDDTALQDRHIIGMGLFDKIFTPRFRRLYSHAHGLGMDTFIHTCGFTFGILDSLIEAGLDAANLDQQHNMGMEKLAERYKGKVCFYCPLDIQRTPGMSDGEIITEVRRMVEYFSSEAGGFIPKNYTMPLSVGMDDHYLEVMIGEFVRISHGRSVI